VEQDLNNTFPLCLCDVNRSNFTL